MEAFEVLLKNLSSYDINDVADIIAKLVVTMVAVSIGIVISRIAKKFVTKIVVKHNRFSSYGISNSQYSIISYYIFCYL
mgnify:CR=1 FL=1